MSTICNICPRKCNTDRSFKPGICGVGDKLKINLYQLHYGEEPIISGIMGSGTIFFSGCNLKCLYCQNYSISFYNHGKEYSIDELSNMMLELQAKKAHNINLVTPTHFTSQIKEALILAKQKGLKIPVVWNTNAYEEADTLKTMEGLVDIYMPDFKYFEPEMSFRYSGARNYPEKAKEAIREMFRQTGHIRLKKFQNTNSKFQINKNKETTKPDKSKECHHSEGLHPNTEIAYKGLMIRLLLLPGNINSIEKTVEWIYENSGNETYISLMGQYYPTHKAFEYKELSRGITQKEYMYAQEQLEKYGFENGFIQDVGSDSGWTPEFLSE